ncbi:hypothetical protein AC579_955 [Pseudocercospora musae]|uniref:Uncharacterized protein n=1 Tax=Pseudocercospora musae TaxID=113226 RepID=A0A139IU86_9PEZI|nr:hypothetical protein AC579_955 [Pseudocercospora musae]
MDRVFEIKAFDAQAGILLETVNDINGQLDAAKALRKQHSRNLSSIEKRLIDSTFENTKRALTDVAELVEPCRGSTETKNHGEHGMQSTLTFVLRDSPRIAVSLSQLGLASQRLQTALSILCIRDSSHRFSTSSLLPDSKAPLTYEESQFLTESRTRNMLRRASSDMSLESGARPRHRRVGSQLENVVEHPEFEDLIKASDLTQLSLDQNDELCFVETDISSSARRYIPYKPGITSPSMSSLATKASTPDVLRPGLQHFHSATVNGSVEFRASLQECGQSLPPQGSDGSVMAHDCLTQGAQSPALSAVDGFEETQRQMAVKPHTQARRRDSLCNEFDLPQPDGHEVHRATEVERRASNSGSSSRVSDEHSYTPLTPVLTKAWVRRSLPTIPVSVHSSYVDVVQSSARPSHNQSALFPDVASTSSSIAHNRTTTAEDFPAQLELPHHITAHEPALSIKDLETKTSTSPVVNHEESLSSNKRDWETLPSQMNRERLPSTFICTCESSELAPRPLLNNVVKLEIGKEDTRMVQQTLMSISRKPVPTSLPKVSTGLLESEFPEVVTKDTISLAIQPPSPGSELPELVLKESDVADSQFVTIVTGVSANLLERKRTQRLHNAQLRVQSGSAPEMVNLSPSAHAPEPLSTIAIGITTKKAPPMPPKSRRSSKSAKDPSLSMSTAPSVPEIEPALTNSQPISGRARSQRWRELQFERSQLLPSPSS